MAPETRERSKVGIELMPGEEADAVAAACEESDEAVEVSNLPGAIYVEAPGRLEVRIGDVSDHLGREFTADDLQIIMASYFGMIEQWDDEAVILAWTE